MERFIMTVGYIPKNCDASTIVCGDTDESGTYEVNLIIEDDAFSSLEFEETYDASEIGGWFEKESQLWKDVIEKFLKDLAKGEAKLSPTNLASAWAFFQDEEGDFSKIKLVANEDDGAEFSSSGHKGKFYIRYYLEDNDEVFGEKIIVLK